MAKRKGQEGQIKRLLKILPTAILVMIICVGVLIGVLIETGRLSLSDVQQTMGFATSESTAAKDTIPEAAKAFAVHVIDVGQGDSILITAGDKSILIDAGEKEYGSRVVSFIRDKGIERLDYIIATHPHADHIGGMAEVVSELERTG